MIGGIIFGFIVSGVVIYRSFIIRVAQDFPELNEKDE